MAGHSPATNHFYGIWSVYACERPDRIDPVLGTAADLRSLVEEAHQHGIRVFLDVIAHGVVEDSDLVRQHPEWFLGGTWGMRDYDYTNPEFRRWWIDTWVAYVRDFDIDGFRVDVALIDESIWDQITERCTLDGKPIAVFPENGRYHFSQHDNHGAAVDPVLDWAIAREFRGNQVQARLLSSHDRGWEGLPGNHYVARGSRAKMGYGLLLNPQIPIFLAGEEFDADPSHVAGLTQALYGGNGPGGWMYGAQLDWSQLEQEPHKAVLDDTKAFLAARRRYSQLLNADPSTAEMLRVAGNGAAALVPFVRFHPGQEAILVVGNELSRPVQFTLSLPLHEMGLADAAAIQMTDILGGATSILAPDGFDGLTVEVGADYAPGGGVRAFHLQPVTAKPHTTPRPSTH